MHEQVREGRTSRDTSWRRQNLGKGSHRDGEESRSQGWEVWAGLEPGEALRRGAQPGPGAQEEREAELAPA